MVAGRFSQRSFRIIVATAGGHSAPKRGAVMKTYYGMVAVAGILFGLAAATAGTSDPEVIIYRFPGVYDDGGPTNNGVATVFHCTNFSGVTENVRMVTRGSDGAVKTNVGAQINHLATRTFATHIGESYSTDTNLATGAVSQGTTAIAATSINVVCSGATIDAANTKPTGIALRGIRFSPAPGSQE